jgi:ABC-type proline/glycine betaine transport system ATPase subunit
VLVTHNVDEGLAVASRAAIMLDGKLAREDDCAALDATAYRAAYRAMVVGETASPTWPMSASA